MITRSAAILAFSAALASRAPAQVLLKHTSETPVDAFGQPDLNASLRDVSLIMVEPPRPKTFAVHDKVTIVINETTKQSSTQTIDTKKDASFKALLNQFPDLAKLLEAELANGVSPVAGVDVSHSSKFKGEGKYNRDDKFSDRLTATVIDVRPNGVLVLEAKRTVQKDEERQVVSLSGECRREDVTEQNTVLSTQLSDLTLISKNEGQVKDSATKGIIPRFFEWLFNF
jgi:flagellar L-ring protein precursor FlgH